MLKVGDKVYCYYSFGDFRKGKYYEITFLDDSVDAVGVFCENSENYPDPTIYFGLQKLMAGKLHQFYFYDYFYTNQQLRQKKLEKLNNVNLKNNAT